MLNNGKAKEKCHSNVKVIYLFLGRKSNSRIIMKLGYVSLRVWLGIFTLLVHLVHLVHLVTFVLEDSSGR